MTNNTRIVVFGDLIDDIVVVPEHAVRPDTDTRASIRHRAGGSAANAAAWMASLGAMVDFVGMVGAGDAAGHAARLPGVRTHIAEHPELPTGTIVVLVDGDSRTMLTDTGANAAMTADLVTDELLDAASAVHFTGYSLFGSPHRAESVAGLIARATERGVAVCVDPGSVGFITDFGVDEFLDAIAGATILFPNLEEGRLLTGLGDPLAIVLSLAQRFEIVALTLDAGGVIVARRGGPVEQVPAAPVEIVDPTGAGDAFAAGFLTAWLASGDLAVAAHLGVQSGALAVSTVGGRPRDTAG